MPNLLCKHTSHTQQHCITGTVDAPDNNGHVWPASAVDVCAHVHLGEVGKWGAYLAGTGITPEDSGHEVPDDAVIRNRPCDWPLEIHCPGSDQG